VALRLSGRDSGHARTITIIRTGESRSALKHLKNRYRIEKRWNEDGEVWAYEVEGYGIPIRIIQSEHLTEAGNVLLRHLRKDLDINTLKKVLEEGEVYRSIRLLEANLQVLLEANEKQFKEITALMNSPIIERVLEESGWTDKIRNQERQVWEEKWQKAEAERQHRLSPEPPQPGGQGLHR
jgi:hypothetical protein